MGISTQRPAIAARLLVGRPAGTMGAMVTLDNVIVLPPAPDEKLDFRGLFGDDGPVEMEIGCGKGGFILRRAMAFPDRRFFGIEWANKFYRYAADRMVRRQIPNVRLMRTDAALLVLDHLPPACLTMLHIYHPDPWPKKRHHKRRLIQPRFVAAAVDALVAGGRLAVQTDHADYFEQIREVLRGESRLTEVPFDVPEAGVVNGRIESNYEIKYLKEGRSIHQIAMIKAAAAQQTPAVSPTPPEGDRCRRAPRE